MAKKQKRPVRKWVKWAWLLFWTALISPFAYFGYIAYKGELPQMEIPFERFVKPKDLPKEKELPKPVDEKALVDNHTPFDVRGNENVRQLEDIMANQGLSFLHTSLYSVSKTPDKELATYRLFYNGDFILEVTFSYVDGYHEFVHGDVLPLPEKNGDLAGDVFAGEFTDFLSQAGNHLMNQRLVSYTITPETTTYEFEKTTYVYNRLERTVAEK